MYLRDTLRLPAKGLRPSALRFFRSLLVALKANDPEYWNKYVKDPAGVPEIRADIGLIAVPHHPRLFAEFILRNEGLRVTIKRPSQ